jgi:aspartate/methionine/tyrosine aminotransferase
VAISAYSNLTELERAHLSAEFNLTDGHVYRAWSAREEAIVGGVEGIFRRTDRRDLAGTEQRYVSRFMTLMSQTYDPESHRYLVCNSASEALEIVANFLRMRQAKLALIEPCFDNLADIFMRHAIPLSPLNESILVGSEVAAHLDRTASDAVCIVSPNNPTGEVISRQALRSVIEYCKSAQALLILDASFRAYTPDAFGYDQYFMLAGSGVDYAVIEDTGKTWPTMELKAPILTVSRSIEAEVYRIYTDFMLHPSPFTVALLAEFVESSLDDDFVAVRGVIAKNREVLMTALGGSLVMPVERPWSSVSWLNTGTVPAQTLAAHLATAGVHILPGEEFFWSSRESGTYLARVALARTPEHFKVAARMVGEVCSALAPA